MQQTQIRTDWAGLLGSLLMPAVIVAGLIETARRPPDPDSDWIYGIFALAILESARVCALGVLQTVYENYTGTWQAVKLFLAILAALAAMLIVGGGASEVVSTHPWMQQAVLLPVLVIAADMLVSLLLFRGDPRMQAARIDAMMVTSASWLQIAVTLAVFGIPALILFAPKAAQMLQAELRPIALLYAAAYFTGKAILLAYLHTGRFLRTGRCLLGREKQKAIDARRAALLGVDPVS